MIGSEAVNLRDCRLVHHDEIVAAASPRTTPIKNRSSLERSVKVALQLSKQLLANRIDSWHCVQAWEFSTESEAHDEELIKQYYAEANEARAAIEQRLSAAYGPPASAGASQHREIQHGGIIRYSLWNLEDRKLYLITAHEDTELLVELLIGTLASK